MGSVLFATLNFTGHGIGEAGAGDVHTGGWLGDGEP